MVVQHNLQAMNSNRMLSITTKNLSASTEKLSSGYKINRAADNAAGLSISEKMRKQIRGLTQASTNSEDGISMVQTAEGALAEVHDMLQRMNELCVQAANGTSSVTDRKYIQDEIDQLISEIDRVSETTKFNETYLLKGDELNGKRKVFTTQYLTTYARNQVSNAAGRNVPGNKVHYRGTNNVYITSTDIYTSNTNQPVSSDTIRTGDDITQYMVRDEQQPANKAGVTLDRSKYVAFVAVELNSALGTQGDNVSDLYYDATDGVVRANQTLFVYDTVSDTITHVTADSNMGEYLKGDNTMKDRYKLVDVLDGTISGVGLGMGNMAGVSYTTVGAPIAYASPVANHTVANVIYVDSLGTQRSTDYTKGMNVYTSSIGARYGYVANTSAITYMPTNAQVSIAKDTGIMIGSDLYMITESDSTVDYYSTVHLATLTGGSSITLNAGDLFSYQAYSEYTDVINNTQRYTGIATAKATAPASGVIYLNSSGGQASANYSVNSVVNQSKFGATYGYALDPNAIKLNANNTISLSEEAGVMIGSHLYIVSESGQTVDNWGVVHLSSLDGTQNTTMTANDLLRYNAYSAFKNVDDTNYRPSSPYILPASTINGAYGNGVMSNRVATQLGMPQNDPWSDRTVSLETEKSKLYNADGEEVSEIMLNSYFDDKGNYKGGLFVTAQARVMDEVFNSTEASGFIPNISTVITDHISQYAEEVNNDLLSQIQAGADADRTNKVDVNLTALSAAGLKVNMLKSSSIGIVDDNGLLATDAIRIVAAAIQKVSTQRSALGAVQNRLEHTIKNLDNVVENTAYAESRIRDTDMAKEMVNYSNSNILSQAGQSMLAQSNQANQGILSIMG